ncbi:MAG TPA: hypothetical protein VGO47_12785, partial [Chlamydiales bacterium]|nr:hypothetical protein [Chlamydiales bacterium]
TSNVFWPMTRLVNPIQEMPAAEPVVEELDERVLERRSSPFGLRRIEVRPPTLDCPEEDASEGAVSPADSPSSMSIYCLPSSFAIIERAES